MLDPATGVLAGLTPRGQLCVELLDLNREGMPEERKRVYDTARAHLAMVSELVSAGNAQAASVIIGYLIDYQRGKAAFSCAGRRALHDAEAHWRPVLQQLLDLFNSN
jgi:hypothetical protein